ncbi:hypothetical protein EAX61_11945 [Dokdonia sinensis]|uniref:Glycosyltransferase RgtA/B/C/D-like domain-containing protein n=1 Tax=Dokdonia sinensis TaxID=2479847 RepID=A0A3M0G5D4_9FLAO|nr:hypothetical protein [Dokdonia sinensis]RMB57452.1 hypothetical protein EAX61_11945 [Dokdonia sinensis]
MKLPALIKEYRTLDFWLFATIVIAALSKLLLINKGMLAFPDETRVFASANLINSLADGNITQAIADVFSTKGRPGQVIMNLLPVGVQYATGKIFGLSTFQPVNTWPFFLVNFAVYIGILWLQFKIAILIFKNRTGALLGVLIFCCLTNSYVYLRHALPYDKSLIIFYFVLWKLLKSEVTLSRKRSFQLGLWAFFAFLIYPGYILFYTLLIGFFLVYNLNKFKLKNRIQNIAVFLLAGGILLVATELLSRLGNVSYLAISSNLSTSIIQGSFSESYIFLPRYLYEVEGTLGVLICVGILGYVVILLKVIRDKELFKNSLALLFVGSVALLLVYATAGYFFEKVTFYGRLIHQMMPLFCLFLVAVLYKMLPKAQLKLSITVIAIISVMMYGLHLTDYLQYDYPLDVAWNFKVNHPDAIYEEHCELGNSWSMITNYEQQQQKAENPETFKLVNACYFYPVPKAETWQAYEPREPSVLLYEGLHFKKFVAYQFEGIAPEERAIFRTLDLKIKVYD